MAPELHHTRANGLDIAWHAEGEGPVVLLLHGFPDTARTWDRVRPALAAAGYRAISPYLRGYAPTSLPSRDTTQRDLAEDAIALLDALGVQRAVVVGHDWGAAATYATACLAPDRVEKLVAVALPHPLSVRPTPSLMWGARHFLTLKFPWAASRFAKDDLGGVDKLVRRWSPTWAFTKDDLADIKRCFSEPGALDAALGYYRALTVRPPDYLRKKLPMPALLIGGTEDVPPVAAYEASRRGFSGEVQVALLPCGHFPHRERPDAFIERLLLFLG